MYDKAEILNMYRRGESFRNIAKITGVHRKTIAKYCKAQVILSEKIKGETDTAKIKELQEKMIEVPKYKRKKIYRRKYSKEIDEFIQDMVNNEERKNEILGPNHKQKITSVLVHALLKKAGYDIGLSTVNKEYRKKLKKHRETFIRQTYEFGERLEFDYGEVNLVIDGVVTHFYLAVLSSPASNFRQAYLYDNAGKKTFEDAHIRFFDEIGGIYKEVVYDNMRNVVSKFIGRTEKILNEDLVKMSLYYGFEINVTNCYSGNEKGHVEGSVKLIRNKVFSDVYQFKTVACAKQHLKTRLLELNQTSKIQEEKKFLLPRKPKLDVAVTTLQHVSKYSFVQIENNFYSVPEQLTGEEVVIKNYLETLDIYYNHVLVCSHAKIAGEQKYQLDIRHYLRTLKMKPGALKRSQALANNAELKTIYTNYYQTNPEEFIQLIVQHKNKSSEALNRILRENRTNAAKSKVIENSILSATETQLQSYNNLLGGKYDA
jgi:transposase